MFISERNKPTLLVKGGDTNNYQQEIDTFEIQGKRKGKVVVKG